MRIDKYLANLWIVPRRQIKKLLKTWEVLLDDEIVSSPQVKIKEWDVLNIHGEEIIVKFSVHLLIHKPSGYVSSNIDEWPYSSYKDLIQNCPYGELVEIAGRLDVDTEGLLFCSSDGKLIHDIIHPHKKVEKEYYVEVESVLTKKMLQVLESGVELPSGALSRPAKAKKITDTSLQLTITEGKFHQVKNMLQWVWNKVSYLRRDRIWEWTLKWIQKWAWKYLEI